MKEEFYRLYEAMINSETIADGEYYVIHADHIHDFKMAINNYFKESNRKIEKLEATRHTDSGIEIIGSPSKKSMFNKINEIIDRINKMEEE